MTLELETTHEEALEGKQRTIGNCVMWIYSSQLVSLGSIDFKPTSWSWRIHVWTRTCIFCGSVRDITPLSTVQGSIYWIHSSIHGY
ncbi:hypothetical protein LWI28_027821 [Acer negundo]|uniref:Uncharacterized protein n=1 Tax=Acer negundo TaxID=4023 RepID=A0AAD5JY78_ACENE|nr:hypothetical protein LWI28_027821 [Acer negundo]